MSKSYLIYVRIFESFAIEMKKRSNITLELEKTLDMCPYFSIFRYKYNIV